MIEQQETEQQSVVAFWPYDMFPYVLCAAGKQKGKNTMTLEGYGQYGMDSMFAFQPVKMGLETKAELEKLEKEFRAEQAALREIFMSRALKVLPALSLTKAYTVK